MGEAKLDLDVLSFMNNLETELEKVHVKLSKHRLDRILGVKVSNTSEEKELEKKMLTILLDEGNLQKCESYIAKTDDSCYKRRLELLEKRFRVAHVKNSPQIVNLSDGLEGVITIWRPTLGTKNVSHKIVDNVLKRNSDRRLRKTAWYAYKKLSEILQDDFIRLVKLRNKVANEMGYRSYMDLMLWDRDLTIYNMNKYISSLLGSIRKQYNEYLEEIDTSLHISSVEPWDATFFIGKTMSCFEKFFPKESILRKTRDLVTSMGFLSNDSMISIDVSPSFSGGLCVAVEIPYNVHILIGNLENGYEGYLRFLHEFGHALYYSNIRQPFYSLKYLDSSCFVESSGLFFEWLASSAEWLENYTTMSPIQIKDFIEYRKKSIVFEIMNLIANFQFLCSIYKDSDQNLDELWNEIMEATMGFQDKKSGRWVLLGPHVVQQDYLIAHMIANQTMKIMSHKSLINNELGSLLINNYFKPGARIPWKEKIKKVIGELTGLHFEL
jgi:peptidyl-dipeptidase A